MWWMVTAALAQEPPPGEVPLVVEAPVSLTAEQRVDEARRRMAAGDWAGTRIVLDEARAMAPEGPLLADIAYLEAYSHEMEGSSAEALARWDALMATGPTDDVRFRRAETLASLGRLAEAGEALDTLDASAGRSAADRSKIALLRAMWEVRAGEVKPGLKALDQALAAAPPGEIPEFEARARVVLVETAAVTARGLAFTGSDRKKKKNLEQRAALVKGTQDQLVLLIRLGHAPSIVRGFTAAVQVYDDLGDALLAETPPRRLTEEQLRLNREKLAERVSNVWVKASQLAGMAAEWTARVGWSGAGTAELAQRKVEIDRKIEATALPGVP